MLTVGVIFGYMTIKSVGGFTNSMRDLDSQFLLREWLINIIINSKSLTAALKCIYFISINKTAHMKLNLLR